MTKSELVQKLAEADPHLYQRDVEVIVTAIFDEIAAALARGDRVELRGFGAFSVKHRDARIGRNPRTGDSVRVAVTGAGPSVFRVPEMEAALQRDFSPESVAGIAIDPDDLLGDMHCSAEFRAHLVTVFAKRAVAAALGA